MEENAKSQYDGNKTPSISVLKLNKLDVFFTSFNLKVAGEYIVLCNEYILLFRLIIYVLYSFMHFLHFLNRVALHPYCVMGESFIYPSLT